MKLNTDIETLPIHDDDELMVTLTGKEVNAIMEALLASRRRLFCESIDDLCFYEQNKIIELSYTMHVLYCDFIKFFDIPF